jgi:hypothetical protein
MMDHPDPTMDAAGLVVLLLVAAVPALLVVIGAWPGVRRTGHHPAWTLVLLVPFLGLIGLWVLAFKRWPVEDRPEP